MSKTNKVMNGEILQAGLEFAEKMKADSTGTELDSPLGSISTEMGWKTVVLILEKSGFNFSKAAKNLHQAWHKALETINQNRHAKEPDCKPKEEMFTVEALRGRVRVVARERFQQAQQDVDGKMPKDQKAAARQRLAEAEGVLQRYGWLVKAESKAADAGSVPNGKAPSSNKALKPNGAPAKEDPLGNSQEIGAAPLTRAPETVDAPSAEAKAVENAPGSVAAAASSADPKDWTCPLCQGPMVERISRAGKNSGSKFLGCKKFGKTRCSGTRDLDGKDTTRG